jgi:hypothetical protein
MRKFIKNYTQNDGTKDGQYSAKEHVDAVQHKPTPRPGLCSYHYSIFFCKAKQKKGKHKKSEQEKRQGDKVLLGLEDKVWRVGKWKRVKCKGRWVVKGALIARNRKGKK